MSARKRTIHKRINLSPHPGHSQKPGSHGKARRTVNSNQRTIPPMPRGERKGLKVPPPRN